MWSIFRVFLHILVSYFYKISLNISDTLSSNQVLNCKWDYGLANQFYPKAKNVIMSRKICFKSFGVIGIKRKYNLCLLKFIKSKQALSTNSLIKANVVNVKYFLMICKYIFSNLCFYHIFLSFETQKKKIGSLFSQSLMSLCILLFSFSIISKIQPLRKN